MSRWRRSPTGCAHSARFVAPQHRDRAFLIEARCRRWDEHGMVKLLVVMMLASAIACCWAGPRARIADGRRW